MFDFCPDLKVGWILNDTFSLANPLRDGPTFELRLSPKIFSFGASSDFCAEMK